MVLISIMNHRSKHSSDIRWLLTLNLFKFALSWGQNFTIFLRLKRFHGALLQDINKLRLAVRINLPASNSLNQVTIIFKDIIQLVFQLNKEIITFSFFYLMRLRLIFVIYNFYYHLHFYYSYLYTF